MMKPLLNQISDRMSFTWFGQSTCLFSLDGLRILTDPVFEHKKRLRPPPCQLDQLERFVDIVLVSHHHFDHIGKHTRI